MKTIPKNKPLTFEENNLSKEIIMTKNIISYPKNRINEELIKKEDYIQFQDFIIKKKLEDEMIDTLKEISEFENKNLGKKNLFNKTRKLSFDNYNEKLFSKIENKDESYFYDVPLVKPSSNFNLEYQIISPTYTIIDEPLVLSKTLKINNKKIIHEKPFKIKKSIDNQFGIGFIQKDLIEIKNKKENQLKEILNIKNQIENFQNQKNIKNRIEEDKLKRYSRKSQQLYLCSKIGQKWAKNSLINN